MECFQGIIELLNRKGLHLAIQQAAVIDLHEDVLLEQGQFSKTYDHRLLCCRMNKVIHCELAQVLTVSTPLLFCPFAVSWLYLFCDAGA
jgi:hypothetical protein